MIKRAVFTSKRIILFIALFWFVVMGVNKPWQKSQITNDVVSYYSYLPATFIYHDLTLSFIDTDIFFADKFWPKTAPNGKRVIKMSMGLSMMYSPFFFIGHFTAPLFGQPQDGYSMPYQVCLMLSCLFYLLLGLYYLRKLLLFYFADRTVSLTLFAVFFGTNLLWYSTIDGLMSHGYLFCLLIIFIYQTHRWYKEPKMSTIVLVGLLGGLLTLIRPTLILCFLIFILYGVYNVQTFSEKIRFLLQNIKAMLVLLFCFLLIQLPQLIYWKYTTDSWLFFSYVGERFYFNDPHIIDGVFGFRKGWLLYTPIMVFSFAGFYYMRKELRVYLSGFLLLILISIYVIFSWWCWWYGGSFGQRPLVDFYGMLAIPMACFFQMVFGGNSRLLKGVTGGVIFLLVILNLFQTYQYKKELIHYDSMTKEAYLKGFFATHHTVEWYESLNDPDYDRIRLGLPEMVSQEELLSLKPSDKISLKGFNLRFITAELGAGGNLTSSRYERQTWEKFSIIHLGGNKIALKADNGKYVCADRSLGWELVANRDAIGAWETFELLPVGNKIVLRADNKKCVMVNNADPYRLVASADSTMKEAQFRVYINY